MRVLKCFVGLGIFVAFLAGSAAAHNLTINHPGTGEPINAQWIGGPLLPAQATGEGLFFHPLGLQPAAHNQGLPNACSATESSPAVTILAPPMFTTCIHGNP